MHPAAALGFQAGSDAYERGRPSYPAEALAGLLDRTGLGEGCTVVDLGAGTGKFSRLLVPTGAHLIAVEPVERMRQAFQTLLPGVEIREGRAEAIPLPPSSADLVVVAQAFHWFDGAAALREIHRILKPEGMLALIWNVRDESASWVAALTALIDPYEGGTPRFRDQRWREAFGPFSGFGELSCDRFPFHQPTSPQGVVDRILSISFIAALHAEKQQQIAEEVGRILAADPTTRGRAIFPFPYRTELYLTEKRTDGFIAP